MKKSLFLVYTLSTVSILCVLATWSTRIAVAGQDSTQIALPVGAKARLGKGSIRQLAYTPDGDHLVVASSIGVWTYDADTEKEIHLFNTTGSSNGITAFSPDRQMFASASGGYDYTVQLWDLANRQDIISLKGHTSYIDSIAFSPDGKTLATGSADDTVRLWNVDTGEYITSLIGHTDTVTSIAFSPDGKTLATGSWDDTLRFWNLATGEHEIIPTDHSDGISNVVFSPDGQTIAITHYNQIGVQLWDVNTGKEKQKLSTARNIYSLAFSPDSRTLAGGGWTELSLWDIDTGALKATLTAHLESVSSVAFSPDGRTLASASSDELHLWDSMSGAQKGTITGHTQYIRGLVLSPDGHTIAAGHWMKIRLWDTVNMREKAILYEDDWGHWSLAFSPDGSLLLSEIAPQIRVWDVATGTHSRTLKTYTGSGVGGSGIEAIVFSPDGRFFANGHTGEPVIWLWYAGFTHKSTLTGHKGRISALAFSPDSRTLASGSSDHTIRLWDVETSTYKMTLTGHTERIESVAFSPNGKTLASASRDETIRLWDTISGVHKATLTAGTDSVTFSPDGKTLASDSDYDGIIQLWDVATGTVKATLTGHTEGIAHVIFSHDGNTLISASYDGTILLWDLSPATDTITHIEDVNRDGVVNHHDLAIVASHFGEYRPNEMDINSDGIVNIVDLVLVAAVLGAGDSAPPIHPPSIIYLTAADLQLWLTQARQAGISTPTFQNGIAILERFLVILSPKETALLPNYPNPFNPETWIPYQLAIATDVTFRIYSTNGVLVRTLMLGYQPVGVYESRTRAAYWDGKNDLGESVASGVYFYTLSTGQSTMTRRMVIRK